MHRINFRPSRAAWASGLPKSDGSSIAIEDVFTRIPRENT
jgi:hypothetical protein